MNLLSNGDAHLPALEIAHKESNTSSQSAVDKNLGRTSHLTCFCAIKIAEVLCYFLISIAFVILAYLHEL